jgi:hypothetical protein
MPPPNQQQAFLIGALIGGFIVGVLCGLVPLIVGIVKKRPVLGVVGFVSCVPCGLLLGLLLAGPVAAVFTIIIAVQPTPESYNSRGYDRDDYDERPRRRRSARRRDEEYDDSEDDQER